MSRVPAGQVRRSASVVSSVTHAPGRRLPSPSTAGPVLLLGQHQGVADAAVDVEANGVADVALHQGFHEPAGGTGGIGPGHDGVHDGVGPIPGSVAGPPHGRKLAKAASSILT